MFQKFFLFDLQRFATIKNNKDDKLVSGTDDDDTIQNGGNYVTINADDGNDEIHNNYRGYVDSGTNVTIDGGAGNDYILNDWADDVMIYGGAGNDYIDNETSSGVTIDAGDGNDYIFLWTMFGTTLDAGSGDDSIRGGGGVNSFVDAGDGNDSIWGYTYGKGSSILAGSGNDTFSISDEGIYIDGGADNDLIENDGGKNVTILGGAGSDSIYSNYDADNVTIDAGAGNDSITYRGNNVSVCGGKGNDFIQAGAKTILHTGDSVEETIYPENVTIEAGKGNDTIDAEGNNSLFIYNDGDGKDKIIGFNTTDTLQIAGGTFSTKKSGSNVIVTVGDGKISLIGAASLSKLNIDFEKTKTDSWTLDGTTATYGSLVVTGVKSLDGLSLSGKILTVSKSSLGTEKIFVSDGYKLALGSDVSSPTTKKSWTLKNSTATYKQTTTAGYELVDNEIIYSKKVSKTLATVKGVKSLDGLKLSGKILTVSKSSLGTEKISVSDGYTLALGSDVSSPTTKKSWTLKNSTATYKQTTTAGYELVDNEIIYSKKVSKTLATVKGVKDLDGLKVSGSTIKLSGDSLSKKIFVSGDYKFDFASDFKNASIIGSSSDDTIIARGKNLSVTGGAGADIFQLKSTGVISDYEAEDKISLTSGAAEVSTGGSDLIFNGKLTVSGGADKTVTYLDAAGEHVYQKNSDGVEYNAEGTDATLTAKYFADEFTPNEYSDHADLLKTIDASAVDYNLKIVGNKRANKIIGTGENDHIDGAGGKDTITGGDSNDKIYGGEGNDSLDGGLDSDSLWGGAGDDTLRGGDGYDFFIYRKNDGNDVISDYDSDFDTVMILSGAVKSPTSDGTDVIFKVGSGQILFPKAASKYIELVDKDGNQLKQWTPK